MEMISVKEQEIIAATARLKKDTDYRTIVLENKTPPEVPPEPRRDGGRGGPEDVGRRRHTSASRASPRALRRGVPHQGPEVSRRAGREGLEGRESHLLIMEQTDSSDSVAGPTPTFTREDDALGKSSISICATVGFTY